MPKQVSPLQRFVEERLELMAIAEDHDKHEAAKQGVSIRLDPGKVRIIDHMAKQLDISRQALLLELVLTGLGEVIASYCNTFGEDSQKVYREIMGLSQYAEGDI
jgi:hypothetical protein